MFPIYVRCATAVRVVRVLTDNDTIEIVKDGVRCTIHKNKSSSGQPGRQQAARAGCTWGGVRSVDLAA